MGDQVTPPDRGVGGIVVIDDEEAIARLLEVVLRHAGLGPTRVFTDGAEALLEVRRDPPDLLLLDLSMPRVDGFTVLEELRRVVATRPAAPLPVLVLTAESEGSARERSFTAGAWSFVRKPFDPGTVTAEARRLLDVSRAARGDGLGWLVRRQLDALASRGCATLIDDRLPGGVPGPGHHDAYRAVSLALGALAARDPRSLSVRVEPTGGGVSLTARAVTPAPVDPAWDLDLMAALPASWWTASHAEPGEVVLELFVPPAAATGTVAG
jgi:DNA-binding response OmpR family regulator